MTENEKPSPAADPVGPAIDPAKTGIDAPEASDVSPVPTPEEINAVNAARSTGKIRDDGRAAPFFSSSDVRAMTRDQVRSNLSRILKSMESGKF